MNNKGLLLAAAWLVQTTALLAQQLPLLAQYRENHLLLNPASISVNYINNNSGLSAGVLGRYQWVGIPDAPRTQTAYCSYFWEDSDIAFGGYVLNDQTGALGFSGAYGQFSYVIPVSRRGQRLAFGISGGFVQYRANVGRIKFRDTFDPTVIDNVVNKYYPDFGLGIYYNYDKFLYAGISVPQVFGLNLQYRTADGDFEIQRMQHAYGIFGGFVPIGEKNFIEPSVWVQVSPNSPININTNVRTLLAVGGNFELWFGGGYSTSQIVHLETGFTMTGVEMFGAYDGLKFGISYDHNIAEFAPHFTSAYEIHIGYYIDI